MTGNDLKHLLKRVGLTQEEAAALAKKDLRTIQRYIASDEVPHSVGVLFRLLEENPEAIARLNEKAAA